MSPEIKKGQTRESILPIDPESIRARISRFHLIPSEFYAFGQGKYSGKVFRYVQSAYSPNRQEADNLAEALTELARREPAGPGPDQVVVVGVDIDREGSGRRGKIVFNHGSLGFWEIKHDLSADRTFISWMKGERE